MYKIGIKIKLMNVDSDVPRACSRDGLVKITQVQNLLPFQVVCF